MAFYKQTDQLLNDLLVWLQKGKGNKHYASGYPLITVLMCIVSQEATFDQQRMVDLITQRLHKLLRERVVFNDLVRFFARFHYCTLVWVLRCVCCYL